MACTFPTTTPSVNDWLDALNLGRYKPQFAAASLTDVAQLHSLADEALQAAGVTLIGHRKRMLQAVKHLQPPPGPGGLPSAPPVPTPPLEARMMDMDVDDMDDHEPRRRDRSLNFGMTKPVELPDANDRGSGSGSGGGGGSSSSTAGPTPMDDFNSQARPNSMSSIYITSTLTQPDTEEIVFCIAVVIHERIQQGEAQGKEARNKFHFFSEDNNPLYAPPPERDGRGSDDSGSDTSSSMKRTKREVRSPVISHELPPCEVRAPRVDHRTPPTR